MGPNDGLVPFFRRVTTEEFALSHLLPHLPHTRGLVSTQGDGAIYSQKEFSAGTKLTGTLTLDFSAPVTLRK